MNQGAPPFAALDDILSQTRHLLLDFDGPVCSLFAGTPTAPIADRLRKVLTQQGAELPQAIQETADWFEILSFAVSISPALAAQVESELTEAELSAVSTAAPTAYVHEVVSSCRESGRSIAVVSNNSARAVDSYLTRHGLDQQFGLVVARTGPDPSILKPSPHLIEQAASALDAVPSACSLIGDSPADIESARLAGAHSIGYARTPDKRERLDAVGAGAIVATMADLALRLRARPLPS